MGAVAGSVAGSSLGAVRDRHGLLLLIVKLFAKPWFRQIGVGSILVVG